MDIKKIQAYQKQLEGERARLLAEIKQNQVAEDFGSDLDHGDEESNETESLANRLAEAQTSKERVGEIDSALNKIKTGKFGACEHCGREIEEKILKVAPESRFCKNCKRESA